MPLSGTTQSSSGVVVAIRSFLASWVAVLKTRVDILSTEIEEQREWLQWLTFMAVGALFFLSLGVLLLTLFVVVMVWNTGAGPWVLGAFALLYLAGGAVLGLMLRSKLRSKPRIFATTAAELAKDYASLEAKTP